MLKIENLYRQYKQDVFYYLMGLTHNPTLSEDLLSETFLKAIHALPRFKENSSIKTWLFGIARNLWLQHLRGFKAQVEYDDLLEIYITESMEDRLIAKETIFRIHELLSTKDERTRNIVNMRIDGFSYSEISEKIGVSESSARVIDFRVKKWIQSKLEMEGLH
ncbi:RNA polymerase sigma factor [Alkaliphilus oremlandii]|uniref:RNA polymerase, sigma-24 subunit, ECF subfamily n=1 Tax=Alkaliphilus oremlandii (strain OhILAs) TaxID=350688 RepID=A8MF08_ALKOO|nr:RNA polymerase sigma factor [Alkaliphilus oremlandii]ABW18487.1 RNA polymerase, sigma-24 subunit, ECF subfamily [Alkaliphilus oremlandii OhILAs]